MFKMHCYFKFPLNSKQKLADEWLRINRSRPVNGNLVTVKFVFYFRHYFPGQFIPIKLHAKSHLDEFFLIGFFNNAVRAKIHIEINVFRVFNLAVWLICRFYFVMISFLEPSGFKFKSMLSAFSILLHCNIILAMLFQTFVWRQCRLSRSCAESGISNTFLIFITSVLEISGNG